MARHSGPPLYPAASLFTRLLDEEATARPFVFVVGSALSAPAGDGEMGVPGVDGVVDLIREELERIGDRENLEELERLRRRTDCNVYQEAFASLRGVLNSRRINGIIQRAVLRAFEGGDGGLMEKRGPELENDLCRLEEEGRGWHLRPGLRALGRLLTDHPERFAREVVTTNFDPLIAVAARAAGGQGHPFDLGRDGDPRSFKGQGVRVLHLHGYWRDSNPLHTPYELERERPRLQTFLEGLLRRHPLVFIGYGGWDDVVTAAIRRVVETDDKAEVLWTFHEPTDDDVRRRQERVLDLLDPLMAAGGGSACYHGVDAHAFLPELHRRLEAGRGRVFAEPAAACPYVYGRPIESDAGFFGRELQRSAITTALERRQPVQILGERRMGKTSLLRWVGRRLAASKEPVVELSLASVLKASPLALVQRIAEGLSDVEPEPDAVPEGLSESAWAARLLRRLTPLALLVDECDALLEHAHRDQDVFFDTCRDLCQSGQLLWISASRVNVFTKLQEQGGLTSAFLNDTPPLRPLGPLEPAEARRLAEQGLPQPLADLALEWSGGLPFALQWLCGELWSTPEQPEQARMAFLEGVRPTLQTWWGGLGEREQEFLVRCLEPLEVATLPEAEREVGRVLEYRGLLVEREGAFELPGRAWARHVEEARGDP